jgi:hypothetical protein
MEIFLKDGNLSEGWKLSFNSSLRIENLPEGWKLNVHVS